MDNIGSPSDSYKLFRGNSEIASEPFNHKLVRLKNQVNEFFRNERGYFITSKLGERGGIIKRSWRPIENIKLWYYGASLNQEKVDERIDSFLSSFLSMDLQDSEHLSEKLEKIREKIVPQKKNTNKNVSLAEVQESIQSQKSDSNSIKVHKIDLSSLEQLRIRVIQDLLRLKAPRALHTIINESHVERDDKDQIIPEKTFALIREQIAKEGATGGLNTGLNKAIERFLYKKFDKFQSDRKQYLSYLQAMVDMGCIFSPSSDSVIFSAVSIADIELVRILFTQFDKWPTDKQQEWYNWGRRNYLHSDLIHYVFLKNSPESSLFGSSSQRVAMMRQRKSDEAVFEVLKFLLEKGFDVNAKSNTPRYLGATPLHFAAHLHFPLCVKLLLEQPGVKVNGVTAEGKTPLHHVFNFYAEKDERQVNEIVTMLLNRDDLENHCDDQGNYPLHLALQRGYEYKMLLERFPRNANAKNHAGRYPIDLAVLLGHTRAVSTFFTFLDDLRASSSSNNWSDIRGRIENIQSKLDIDKMIYDNYFSWCHLAITFAFSRPESEIEANGFSLYKYFLQTPKVKQVDKILFQKKILASLPALLTKTIESQQEQFRAAAKAVLEEQAIVFCMMILGSLEQSLSSQDPEDQSDIFQKVEDLSLSSQDPEDQSDIFQKVEDLLLDMLEKNFWRVSFYLLSYLYDSKGQIKANTKERINQNLQKYDALCRKYIEKHFLLKEEEVVQLEKQNSSLRSSRSQVELPVIAWNTIFSYLELKKMRNLRILSKRSIIQEAIGSRIGKHLAWFHLGHEFHYKELEKEDLIIRMPEKIEVLTVEGKASLKKLTVQGQKLFNQFEKNPDRFKEISKKRVYQKIGKKQIKDISRKQVYQKIGEKQSLRTLKKVQKLVSQIMITAKQVKDNFIPIPKPIGQTFNKNLQEYPIIIREILEDINFARFLNVNVADESDSISDYLLYLQTQFKSTPNANRALRKVLEKCILSYSRTSILREYQLLKIRVILDMGCILDDRSSLAYALILGDIEIMHLLFAKFETLPPSEQNAWLRFDEKGYSLMSLAVTNNSKLLSARVDVCREKWLVEIIENKSEEVAYNMLTFLLEKNFDPNVGQNRPLYCAAESKFVTCVKLLLEHMAEANCASAIKENTPLHMALASVNEIENEEQRVDEIVDLLLDKVDDQLSNTDGHLPIHFAAKKGDRRNFKKLLDKFPDSINHVDQRNPIDLAIAYGHIELVQEFCDDPLEEDQYYKYLEVAILNHSFFIFEYFLEKMKEHKIPIDANKLILVMITEIWDHSEENIGNNHYIVYAKKILDNYPYPINQNLLLKAKENKKGLLFFILLDHCRFTLSSNEFSDLSKKFIKEFQENSPPTPIIFKRRNDHQQVN
ncbi:MAG: ankyrin repeat domain-containing protein [Chlamydiales bacterium]